MITIYVIIAILLPLWFIVFILNDINQKINKK